MSLTVVTPSDTYDLTTLSRIKLELSISDTDSDELLTQMIAEQSEIFASLTKRVLASETVSETFHLHRWGTYGYGHRSGHSHDEGKLVLKRYPVTSVISVTVDSVVLDAGLYAWEEETGFLFRRNAAGHHMHWSGREAAVVYVGGYQLLATLPRRIESAVISMVKGRWFSSRRDPAIRSENVVGVLATDYWVGQISTGTASGLPPDVDGAANYYRDYRIG